MKISINIRLAILCVCFIFVMPACVPKAGKVRPDVLISNVTIIDAVNDVRTGMSVEINGNRIIAIYPASSVVEASKHIDGTGKYLIPGLWDAHIHMTFDPDVTEHMFDLFLVNGVTSIRDVGGQLNLVMPWKKRSQARPKSTPRLLIAGPLLDGKPRVYDGGGKYRPELGVELGGLQEVEAIVDSLASQGVDLIKAYEMLSPQQFEAVLDRARQHGLPVTGHVPLSMDVVSASDMGLKSIEHLSNLELSCAENWEELLHIRRMLLEEGKGQIGEFLRARIHSAQRQSAIVMQDSVRTDELLNTLVENETWLTPTLCMLMVTKNRLYAEDEWVQKFQYLPSEAASKWEANAREVSSVALTQSANEYANWAKVMVGKLSERDVRLLAGTDAPVFLLTPGFSLHEELRLMVASGMSALQAIESATIRPAQYFGMEDSLGSVEVNKLADLVLLDGDPLEDITNIGRINTVIKDGYALDRNRIDSMLRYLSDN